MYIIKIGKLTKETSNKDLYKMLMGVFLRLKNSVALGNSTRLIDVPAKKITFPSNANDEYKPAVSLLK